MNLSNHFTAIIVPTAMAPVTIMRNTKETIAPRGETVLLHPIRAVKRGKVRLA